MMGVFIGGEYFIAGKEEAEKGRFLFFCCFLRSTEAYPYIITTYYYNYKRDEIFLLIYLYIAGKKKQKRRTRMGRGSCCL